jgi:hypothetical protein
MAGMKQATNKSHKKKTDVVIKKNMPNGGIRENNFFMFDSLSKRTRQKADRPK